MKALRFFALLFVLIFFQSCATLLYGPKQKVSINSSPPGAEIYVNGVNTKKATPSKVKVKKRVWPGEINGKNEIVYTLKKDGFYDAEYRDNSEVRGLILYLDFIYLLVPGLIDVATGSHLKYQDHLYLNMNKKETIIQKEIVYVPTGNGSPAYVYNKNSDVDQDIPTVARTKENRFALIIGNEDYSSYQLDLSSEVNVDFARNDASAFKEYAQFVLGIPEENITFLLDATTGKMSQSISKLSRIIEFSRGNAEVFVYYAGHGLPDEQTKEPYIMPVDVSGKNAADGVSLKEMYRQLTQHPSKRVTVFIDACFSGGARNQGLLSARGVKINPKESPLGGNLVVFSASSGDESSLPYKDKEHGFFTYYLLKKLKETNGNVSYLELSDYLQQNVALKSVVINDKVQTPKVSVSGESQDVWETWKVNE